LRELSRRALSGDEVLEKIEREHAEMRALITELRAMTGQRETMNDATYDEKFFELMRQVIHHVADEETKLLPAADRLLRDQLGRLGIEMTKRRLELLKPHAAEFAETTLRSFPAGAAAGAALLVAGAVASGAMLFSRRGRSVRHGRLNR